MITPKRVQLSRTKGWRMPADTVKVDRTTQWGNPWPVGDWGPLLRKAPDALGAVGLFEQMFTDPEMRVAANYPTDLSPLRGKHLACWCPLNGPCHADVLLRLANADNGGGHCNGPRHDAALMAYCDGLRDAATLCDVIAMGLDNAGHYYVRHEVAAECAAAIRRATPNVGGNRLAPAQEQR